MRIREIIWLADFVYKIRDKHGVTPEEVEYVLERRPHLRYVERGHVKGEDLYQAWGQTPAGRYLIVFFIHKKSLNLPLKNIKDRQGLPPLNAIMSGKFTLLFLKSTLA